MTNVDFSTSNLKFFLHTKRVKGAANTDYTSIPGGLIPGQPLVLTVDVSSPYTILHLLTQGGLDAPGVNINFETDTVHKEYTHPSFHILVSQSVQTPAFDFTNIGREVSVLYIVSSNGCLVYVDNALLFDFKFSYPLEYITAFKVDSEDGKAKIISFQR